MSTGTERDPLLLFRSGYQARKLRIVTWVFVLASFVAMGYGVAMMRGAIEPGPTETPDDIYYLGMFLLLFGLAIAYGFRLYTQLYVTKLTRARDVLQLTTAGIVWPKTRDLPIERLYLIEDHEGRFRGRISVNAPYFTVKVRGWLFPLIFDVQAETVHRHHIDNAIGRGAQLHKAQLNGSQPGDGPGPDGKPGHRSVGVGPGRGRGGGRGRSRRSHRS